MKKFRTSRTFPAIFALSACEGPQSAFDAAGAEAARVLTLFWVMLIGAVAIWAVVVAIGYYATKTRPGQHSEKAGLRLIIWGGCVFPTVVLAMLLFWGLRMMPDLRPPVTALPSPSRVNDSGGASPTASRANPAWCATFR